MVPSTMLHSFACASESYTELVGYRLTVLLGKETAAVDVFQFLHADALHTGMGDYLFTVLHG